MLSDPRTGLIASLVIVLLAGLWLVAQWLFSDGLFAVLGYAQYAITLLSIFLLLGGSAVALLFRRFSRIRTDLLEGRNGIARWTVDPQSFRAFAAVADECDREDKRGALFLVLIMIAVIFGAFALFDLEAAPAMLSMAAAVAIAVVLAYLYGNRVRRKQLEPRSGEIIIGTDGVLVNGVLHVWSVMFTWLRGATLEPGPPAILTINYAFLARYGVQQVGVMLPVPLEAARAAEKAERQLNETAGANRLPKRRLDQRDKSRDVDH